MKPSSSILDSNDQIRSQKQTGVGTVRLIMKTFACVYLRERVATLKALSIVTCAFAKGLNKADASGILCKASQTGAIIRY